MYQTNKGLLLAAEDIKYSKNTGLMGDQDFNDVLVGLLTFADGTPLVPVPNGFPVPEPASLGLLMTGLLLMSRKGWCDESVDRWLAPRPVASASVRVNMLAPAVRRSTSHARTCGASLNQPCSHLRCVAQPAMRAPAVHR
ncbi:MAG: PEP-CTERM sorting domain-containing protein [Phycisphaerales bacterium]|nr:PEP-CTERM sorting domain-containing protein [Phycisphaerales bacterium]